MLKNYEHIIWDWNGTLFDDLDLCLDIINNILIKRELSPLTKQKYREIFTFPVKDYYSEAGLDFSKYSFEILGKEWIEEYELRREEANLHDGVEEVLANVLEFGKEQSILSAYSNDTLLEVVGNYNLKSYFKYLAGLDNIYASSKVQQGKNLVKNLNGKSNSILLIGDTLHDYEVAKEIGADCVLIANGHQTKTRLQTSGALVYDKLTDLL